MIAGKTAAAGAAGAAGAGGAGGAAFAFAFVFAVKTTFTTRNNIVVVQLTIFNRTRKGGQVTAST